MRQARDGAQVPASLDSLARDLGQGRNVMPALIEASRSGATLGEMSDVLRREFGEFKEPGLW